jgi:DNA-binding CsgD family transcriptional regulator
MQQSGNLGNPVDGLLDLLYLAPTVHQGWTPALAAIADHLRCSWSGLIAAQAPREPLEAVDAFRLPAFEAYCGIPEDAAELYGSYYAAKDPWFIAAKKRQLTVWAGRGTDLCPRAEFEKTEFYNDFFKAGRYDVFFQLGALVKAGQSGQAVLTLLREKSVGDFDAREVSCIQTLFPHLRRALEIAGHIVGLQDAVRGMAGALATFDVAVIALDATGRCCYANVLGERLLRSGDFLRISGNVVGAGSTSDSSALHQLIKNATSKAWDASPLGGYVTLHVGARTLHVSVVPLANAALDLPNQARVLLTAFSPEAAPLNRERALRVLFRLTAAEVRVSMLLLQGMEPKEISAQTHTTYETVRFQLKTIFQKTGTRRQSQLVRLFSQLPGAV